MKELINYYVIDRKSGVSYTPIIVGARAIIATGNRATDPTVKRIDLKLLFKALPERVYRLTPITS